MFLPPGVLSGSRGKRMVNGSILTVGTALPALFLLALGVAPGVNRRTLSDWLLPLGFGFAFAALSYAFGRITVAAWSEKRPRQRREPGFWPYLLSLGAMLVALASIPLSGS